MNIFRINFNIFIVKVYNLALIEPHYSYIKHLYSSFNQFHSLYAFSIAKILKKCKYVILHNPQTSQEMHLVIPFICFPS